MEYTIRSSHGRLTANIHGEIIRRDIEEPESEDGKHLASIFAVNFAEWCQYWRKPMPSEFDILDLGYSYFQANGTGYAEPDNTWRKDIAQDLLKRRKAPPLGMQMRERLDHARHAVDAYHRSKGEPVAFKDEDYSEDDAAWLIADLLHLQVALGYSVDLTLNKAMHHHAAEQADEHLTEKE